jgi:hypothetical protein
MAPYAQGTKVPVEQTQAEIRKLAKRYGAERFALAEGPEGDRIAFTFRDRRYAFMVMQPIQDPPNARPWYRQTAYGSITDQADAEYRRRWRTRLLWLKTVLEFATNEATPGEADAALAGYLMLPDGRTVAELIGSGGMALIGAGTDA